MFSLEVFFFEIMVLFLIYFLIQIKTQQFKHLIFNYLKSYKQC